MSALKLGTYNVHWWQGTDRGRSPQRIGEVIEALEADVVALQEVHVRDEQDERGDELIRAAGEYQAIACPTITGGGGWFGNALLARVPVMSWRAVDLSVEGREPRGAILARLDVDAPMVVAATHLGLFRAERRQQVAALLAALERFVDADDRLVAVMGDLNEWWPWGWVSATLSRTFFSAASRPTFPASRPLIALDRIFVRPGQALTGVEAHQTSRSRVASDHLPLVARVEL